MAITSFKGEYNFLSNMYPSILYINGEMYPSAEHAFQAAKSLDKDIRLSISVCRSAKEAKEAGKLISLRSDWEDVKVDIMYKILKAKFENSKLADKLKATADEDLIEGNTWGDRFWGVCDGEGTNTLGNLLMKVRSELT
jgi:hypothetical protein